MPKKHNPGGCKCCSPQCRGGYLCVNVTGCSIAFPGCTVNLIQGGVTVASAVTTGQVTSLSVSAGTGYDPASPPTVTISGGGGSGATAIAVMSTTAIGTIANLFLTSFGSGYTSAPTVTVAPPPSGVTAVSTATIATRACLGFVASGGSTIEVVPPSGTIGGRYVTTTASVTLSCATTTQTVAMTVATGYVCCGCLLPVKKALFFTCSEGSFALTYDAVNGWWTLSIPLVKSLPTKNVGNNYYDCTNLTDQTFTVGVKVSCAKVNVTWYCITCCCASCGNLTLDLLAPDSGIGVGTNVNGFGGYVFNPLGTVTCGTSWVVSGTFPSTAPILGGSCTGSGEMPLGGAFTVTE